MTNRISVVVLIRNHRQHIGPCLRTLTWADEIIVVNDDSRDGTVNIARSFPNVRIVHRPLEGDWGAQMNYGLSEGSDQWLLQIDVDERVPPELADELRHLSRRPDIHGIAVRILGSFLGFPMGDAPGSPYAVRMVRKGNGAFENRRVHAQLQVSGAVARAQNLLVHLGPFPTAESFWHKNALYARVEAENNIARGKHLVANSYPSVVLQCILKPIGVFFQRFLLHGYWRRGIAGLHYALMRAIGYYMVYLATWELSVGRRDAIRDYCLAHGIPYLDVDSMIDHPGE